MRTQQTSLETRRCPSFVLSNPVSALTFPWEMHYSWSSPYFLSLSYFASSSLTYTCGSGDGTISRLNCKLFSVCKVLPRFNRICRALRRKYGIPDSDKRPFNVAYSEVARKQEEAKRQQAQRLRPNQPPVVETGPSRFSQRTGAAQNITELSGQYART